MLQRINLIPLMLLALVALISWLVGTWWPLIGTAIFVLVVSLVYGVKDYVEAEERRYHSRF